LNIDFLLFFSFKFGEKLGIFLAMKAGDVFFKSEDKDKKYKKSVEERGKVKVKVKKAKQVKSRDRDDIIQKITFDSTQASQDFEFVKHEDGDTGETVFGEVMRVELSPRQERTRVKYSVSQDVNKRLLITLNMLEELIPYIKDLGLGCSKSEYEKNIIKPLKKFVSTGRVRSKRPKAKEDDNSGTVKLSSFQLPRKAKDEFGKLYRKLEEEGNDMSVISYENGSVSLLDSAKTVRMYFSTHKLKDVSTKHIILDDFLKEVFEGKAVELYTTNGGEFITQRQVQTLASWLVRK
jgi:hypothetical protein